MSTPQQHYETLLAPIYVWMAGGIDAALAAGAADIASFVPGRGLAIDLGAGFGMHALPLAGGGYNVVALDTSAPLLATLRAADSGARVRTFEANLLDFRHYVSEPAQLIVCLGDTLTHLRTLAEVERLLHDVADSLAQDGRAVFTFRDYTRPPMGDARFIPVRSDVNRIHTCFLETLPEHMLVHDIVHEREGTAWRMRVSSYPKLRLAPTMVAACLRAAGLIPTTSAGPRGMVQVTASRPHALA